MKLFTSGNRTVHLVLRNNPSIRLPFFWTLCFTSNVDRFRSSCEQRPCFDSLWFRKLCTTWTRETNAIKTINNEKCSKFDANFIIFLCNRLDLLLLWLLVFFYCCHYDVLQLTVVVTIPYTLIWCQSFANCFHSQTELNEHNGGSDWCKFYLLCVNKLFVCENSQYLYRIYTNSFSKKMKYR